MMMATERKANLPEIVESPAWMVTANSNATHRLEIEHERAARTSHLQLVGQNVMDIVIIADINGTMRYASPSVERMLGYAREEYVGRALFDYIHPDDLASAIDAFTALAATSGNTLTLELRFHHKDGSWRTFETMGFNLLDHPAIEAILFRARDVIGRSDA